MARSTAQRRSSRHRGQRRVARLGLESLETRALPSATLWRGMFNPVPETEPNDTLDQAQNVGDLTTARRAEVTGTIHNGPAGADVDWYRFQLDRPANVSVTAPKGRTASQPVTTLSLYNTDLHDSNDPYNLLGHRLLEQVDSAGNGGTAHLDRRLAPGTYYVAVSGSGNHYFNPFLAGSGVAGVTGDYGLLITAADLGLGQGDGPAVLASDPHPGTTLDHSPFLLRVDVSEPLDQATVSPGGTVQLFTNPEGTFGDGNDQTVALANANLNSDGTELLIAPATPLAPGYYKVVLAGNSSTNFQVLADLNGTPLGASRAHRSGADFSYTFQVQGNEGNTAVGNAPDDSAATAHQLGDLTPEDGSRDALKRTGYVQIAGAIGDDAANPVPFDGSDVDLYHFRVSGSHRYALSAEVFAGRIGSPLIPAVSLFEADPSTGLLSLLSSNTGTLNDSPATNGQVPLYNDPALYAGLQAGDYYLAVSNVFNVPDPASSPAATNGVFDPNVSLSGQNGGPTGDYVLNVRVQPVANPPRVIAVTPADGATLHAPPTSLVVQFSEAVNLPQLLFQSGSRTPARTLAAVYVQGSDGSLHYPRIESYDATTHQATFEMLDGLRNDQYELHLSGTLGLADLAGNALVGNDPSGDIVHFTVHGPTRGTGTNPLLWTDHEPNDSLDHPQDVGPLFPLEAQAGITLQRDFTHDPAHVPADTADYYQFQVQRTTDYVFNFTSASLPAGVETTLFDASGTPLQPARQPGSLGFSVHLLPGTYVLKVGGWTASEAASSTYTIFIQLVATAENPPSLTAGPAPITSIQLATDAPPSPPPPVLVFTPPTAPPPIVVSTPPSPAASTSNGSSSDSSTNSPTQPPALSSGLTNVPTTTQVTTTSPPMSGAPSIAVSPVPVSSVDLPRVAAGVGPTLVSPTLPSGPRVVTVNLVVPSGGNSTAVVPALLRTPSDRPADSVSMPSVTLLALGASPVGGIKEPASIESSSSPDRIVVRLPELPSAGPSQLGTAATPRTDSGTNATDASFASSAPRVDNTGPAVARFFQQIQATPATLAEPHPGRLNIVISHSLRQLVTTSPASALDTFFGMALWLQETALPAPTAPAFLEDLPTLDGSINYEGAGATFPLETAQLPSLTDRVMINGFMAITALAAVKAEKKEKSDNRNPKAEVRSHRSDVERSARRTMNR